MSDDPVTPRISVIIPAFNAAAVLPLQLEALEAQDEGPPFEVIVVDNGSTDATARVIDRAISQTTYPLRRIEAREHQGPGYARNVGVKHASADLLMFADADDVVSQRWVVYGARAFRESDFWSGGSRLMRDDEMTGTLAEIRAGMGDPPEWAGIVPGDLRDAFPVLMGGNFGSTREVYERLGGFDQSLGTVYEDNDLGVRAHLAGIPVDDAPAVMIAFRGKWGLPFRARLARRSARAHAVIAQRYGLRSRSHFPSPWRELPRTVGSAIRMAVGRKEKDWPGVWIRLNTAAGHTLGRLDHRVPGRTPTLPQIGVGLNDSKNEERAR